jgi:hypothetical protein
LGFEIPEIDFSSGSENSPKDFPGPGSRLTIDFPGPRTKGTLYNYIILP